MGFIARTKGAVQRESLLLYWFAACGERKLSKLEMEFKKREQVNLN